jgi:large subunit ribosomal protein L22
MADLEVKTVEKYVRLSPRKVRLVIELVRGKQVDVALQILKMTSKGAALAVSKAINAAAANAENNFGLDRDDLYVKTIYADKGPSRRWRKFGARSRIKPIERRSTHLTVGVSEKESK